MTVQAAGHYVPHLILYKPLTQTLRSNKYILHFHKQQYYLPELRLIQGPYGISTANYL